jgi:hypothetical protein
MSHNWYGMSLGYFRRIKEQPGAWPSCRAIIEHLNKHGLMRPAYMPIASGGKGTTVTPPTDAKEPTLGAFLWFDTPYWGDMALYLDNGWMLYLVDGVPHVGRQYPFGPLLGWTPGIPHPKVVGEWMRQSDAEHVA